MGLDILKIEYTPWKHLPEDEAIEFYLNYEWPPIIGRGARLRRNLQTYHRQLLIDRWPAAVESAKAMLWFHKYSLTALLSNIKPAETVEVFSWQIMDRT